MTTPSPTPLRVLHVEDEPNARRMLEDLLERTVDLVSVATAEEGLARCRASAFDLTLLDWTLPGMDGGGFLEEARRHGQPGLVVVVTALGTLERARAAMRAGAYDFLVKPVDPGALEALVEKAQLTRALLEGADRARPRVAAGPALGPEAGAAAARILGASDAVRSLRARLALVAGSDAPVLITGESGTGKELVARALHEASGRHRARLVPVNCAALPEALLESELFGHRRGAFTGAAEDRAGLFELASGGTLFLDEVGELTPAAQAKLLRALESRAIRRVGDGAERPVDVRAIAATHRDLAQEVERGAFRADLLYRLDVVRLEVPPLRERRGDIASLLARFLDVHAAAYARPRPSLASEHEAALLAHPWPGNVRELESMAKRIVLLGPEIALDEMARRARGTPPPSAPRKEEVVPLDEAVARASREAIVSALRAAGGSRTKAAELLGIARKTLFNKMQELGIRGETSFD